MKTKPHKLTRRYLLTQVKKLILEEPKRMDMHLTLGVREGDKAPSCGTVGCIAGWTCIVAQRSKSKLSIRQAFDRVQDPIGEAVELLNLDDVKLDRLCYLEHWPRDLKNGYVQAASPLQRARVTCKRIDLFLKSGGKK